MGISHKDVLELSRKGQRMKLVAWAARAAISTRTRTNRLDSSLLLLRESRPANARNVCFTSSILARSHYFRDYSLGNTEPSEKSNAKVGRSRK